MRAVMIVIALALGFTAGVNAKRIPPFIGVLPETPEGWKPRMREWKNGVEIFD